MATESISGEYYDREADGELMDTLDTMQSVQGYNYADPETRSFRLDTQDQVVKSWSLLHDSVMEDQYEPEQLQVMRERVRQAARQYGVELQDNDKNHTR